jgi:dihydroorotase-like cyclic amidohydrolase
MKSRKMFVTLACMVACMQLSGCALFTVADAVVTTAATAVKITAKTVGAAADLVIPDSEKKEEKKEAEKK